MLTAVIVEDVVTGAWRYRVLDTGCPLEDGELEGGTEDAAWLVYRLRHRWPSLDVGAVSVCRVMSAL